MQQMHAFVLAICCCAVVAFFLVNNNRGVQISDTSDVGGGGGGGDTPPVAPDDTGKGKGKGKEKGKGGGGGGGGGGDGPGLDPQGGSTNVGGGLPPLPATANPPAGATVGKSLSQFRWVDVKVVGGGLPEIPNIQQVAPGVFKCILRKRGGSHDGNLKAGRQDHKGRAELCCLGGNTPFKIGETWLIGATTLFDKNFQATSFCQISQTPVHVGYFNMNKASGNTVSGGAYVFERGLGSPSKLLRAVSVPKEKWFSWCFKIKFAQNGYYGVSINGDNFQGVNMDLSIGHIHLDKVGKVSQFGNTWGLYMPLDNGPDRDVIVYHANPFIKKIA